MDHLKLSHQAQSIVFESGRGGGASKKKKYIYKNHLKNSNPLGDGLVGLLYTVQYSFGINFNVGFLYLASIYFMFPKHQFLIPVCKSKNNACCEEK